MRTCLVLLLAIMLSLNAAYAAAASVCDVFEQTQGHALHFGHHSHEHDDPDGTGAGELHCHDHAHSGFSSILPDILGVTPLTGCGPLVAAQLSAFVSAPPAVLDQPPIATLA